MCRTDADARQQWLDRGWVEKLDFDCSHGVTAETAPAIQAEALAELPGAKEQGEAAAKHTAEMEAQGRAAWAWLHANAETDSLTMERLAGEFLPMIPTYGCGCRREWHEILQRNPLPVKGQYDWSISVHNSVNQKLGKPLWTKENGQDN